MNNRTENACFEGVLGRRTFSHSSAALRFYEYSFSTMPEAKPVFAVDFEHPEFKEDDVAPLLGAEVELFLFEDRVEITEICGERVAVLRASSVMGKRCAYDLEDYVRRVRQLEEANIQLNVTLVKARKKYGEIHNLVIELLRRAEIKAAATDELRQRQAPTITVLERLLGQFISED